MTRRRTYPRSSFDGTTPSAIRKVIARAWSARTLSARSVSKPSPYARPESSSPSEISGWNWSVSNTEGRFWRIDASLFRPRPVSMLFAGSGLSDVDRLLVELHEHQVPVLEETFVLAARKVVGGAEVKPAVEIQLRARAARSRRRKLPPVLRTRALHDPLTRYTDLAPRGDRLLVGSHTELLVAAEDRDPDVLRPEAESICREVPRESRRLRLEVVAEREVAEHLEEGEVPRGRADDLDVLGSERLLAARGARVRRPLGAQEVGLQRLHAGDREQRGGVVLLWDQRGRGQLQVVPLHEEVNERAPDLVRGHGARECRRRRMRRLLGRRVRACAHPK